MKLTILTTFYKNKQDVLKVYQNYKDNLSDKNIKYMFVNDNFEDEVWNEIEKIAESDKNITALCFDKNYGQLKSIKAGIEKITNGNILYHDSDKIIDKSFIEHGLKLIENNEADIVWGQPKLYNFFFRNVFKVLYKLIVKKNYHYKSLFLINDTVAKILRNAFNSGENIIGEILSSIDVKKKFLQVKYEHNYKNSRYNFFSKFFLAMKHFSPYLESIYIKSIFVSFLLAFLMLLIIVSTFILKLFGYLNFLPGWLSIILLIVFLNMILIFLVCLTSLFNIDQIKNINKFNVEITKVLNES